MAPAESPLTTNPQGTMQYVVKRRNRLFVNHPFFSRLVGMILLGLLLTGCEIFGTEDEAGSDLDEQLRTRLVEASDGKGLSFFLLPESDDFNAIPQDPNNPITAEKVVLGRFLYHETGLLTDPERPEGMFTASCASCHHAQAGFQANLKQGIGDGGTGFGQYGEGRLDNPAYGPDLDVQPIRTPTALNVAYQELMLWNGQFGGVGGNLGTEAQWTAETPKETNHFGFHGVETQAIAGLRVHRMGTIDASMVYENATYKQLFEDAFPSVPKEERMTVENAGLAIAAYERTLLANGAPFQRWLRGNLGAMTEVQKHGALLFFGKAGCVDCHTGPALNSMTFHALGMRDLEGSGVYGDFKQEDIEATRWGRGGFTQRAEDMYAFKTPQLYNLTDSPFYGHGGEFNTLKEVIEYKNAASPSNPLVPAEHLADAFRPLNLTEQEVADLTAFLEGALYDSDLMRYVPASLPTGNCFPVNDPEAKADLGC